MSLDCLAISYQRQVSVLLQTFIYTWTYELKFCIIQRKRYSLLLTVLCYRIKSVICRARWECYSSTSVCFLCCWLRNVFEHDIILSSWISLKRGNSEKGQTRYPQCFNRAMWKINLRRCTGYEISWYGNIRYAILLIVSQLSNFETKRLNLLLLQYIFHYVQLHIIIRSIYRKNTDFFYENTQWRNMKYDKLITCLSLIIKYLALFHFPKSYDLYLTSFSLISTFQTSNASYFKPFVF